MRCEFSFKAAPYFYGELGNEARIEYEKHLEKCEICRQTVSALKFSNERLRFLALEPPRCIVESVMNHARRICDQTSQNWLKYIFSDWRKALLALSFSVLVFFVFLDFGYKPHIYSWDSPIDADIESLEYAMYEEQESFLGDYMEEFSEIAEEVKTNGKGRLL